MKNYSPKIHLIEVEDNYYSNAWGALEYENSTITVVEKATGKVVGIEKFQKSYSDFWKHFIEVPTKDFYKTSALRADVAKALRALRALIKKGVKITPYSNPRLVGDYDKAYRNSNGKIVLESSWDSRNVPYIVKANI